MVLQVPVPCGHLLIRAAWRDRRSELVPDLADPGQRLGGVAPSVSYGDELEDGVAGSLGELVGGLAEAR